MQDVTVTGNDNFVVVAGGDVYLTTAPAAPATAGDRRNLLNLLGHVRRIWITNVLDLSVSHGTLLEPRLRLERGAVEVPWGRYLEAAGQTATIVPPDVSISRVFDELGRLLLILGEPGAGKTTTLLTLARECIERAENDPAAPVPVVLNLSSWTGSGPFRDWLVDELSGLSQGYEVGKAFARRWLEDHRLLLLLDGLDEVAEDRRAGCVQALHAFVEEHGVPGLAVCCRTAEYGALPLRLKLGGAIRRLPLEPAQVDAYLDSAGTGLEGLRGALARSEELSRLSTSPLMLSIMALAFRDLSADALRFDDTSTREELRDEIFGRFVDRMFVLRERPTDGFSRGRMEDGLRWLASGMREGGSIFAVELLQPEWLTRRQLLLYTLGSRAAGATVVTFALAAVVCLGGVMMVQSVGARMGQLLAPAGIAVTLLRIVGVALAMGLLAGLFYALPGYHALRRSCGERRREPGMAEQLGLFFGYLVLSGLAALMVAGIGAWGLGLSLREPSALIGYITVSFSALFLPLPFVVKTGRGSADKEISLAGTLTWRWRTAVELMTLCSVAAVLVALFDPGAMPRLTAGIMGIVAFTMVMYGSWRQEVPPVDRWRDGEGNSALLKSVKVFAYSGVACVLFVLLIAVIETDLSLLESFGAAILMAIVLFGPALFWFGGIDLVLHATLRLVLAFTRTMPLRLRRFLEYAVHLGFLQRAGGGYIFFHRLLLEHFAARLAPAGGPATAPPGAPTVRV